MRTYFRHDTTPPTRRDAYSAKDVVVAYLDASKSPWARATRSATAANAALVQAYDGANNIQLVVVAMADMLPGEGVVLLA